MSTSRLVGVLLFSCWSSAQADLAFEAIEHSCDTQREQFQLYYQVFWNTPAPGGPDTSSAPGEASHSCRLDDFLIETELSLHEPSGQGMCGGVPGGYVYRLTFGEMEILQDMPMNSCYLSHLNRVMVKARKHEIQITFCGSVLRKGKGEEPGCFVEHYEKSLLPRHLYNGSNFPYSKFDSSIQLEADTVR